MLTIELVGNATATCGTTTMTTSSGLDPIGPLCRKLIDLHADPEASAIVVRDGVQVFAKPATLRAWAAHDIVDIPSRGLVRRKWKPFPGLQRAPEAQAV